MFMHVSENRCPLCGVVGKTWMKRPKVFVCPVCNSIFNEFGMILEAEKEIEGGFT